VEVAVVGTVPQDKLEDLVADQLVTQDQVQVQEQQDKVLLVAILQVEQVAMLQVVEVALAVQDKAVLVLPLLIHHTVLQQLVVIPLQQNT
jgi:hypothetical protein